MSTSPIEAVTHTDLEGTVHTLVESEMDIVFGMRHLLCDVCNRGFTNTYDHRQYLDIKRKLKDHDWPRRTGS